MTNAFNITMSFPNLADTPTLSAGSWSGGLPLANLQDRRLKKVARSTDATNASTKFRLTYTTTQTARCFALVNHNISFNGRWRIRAYSDAGFATLTYDSDWQYAWPFYYTPWDETYLEWESDTFWLNNYTAAQIAGYTITSTFIIPSGSVTAQYWQFEIDDAANAAAYVQVGRLFLGPYFQPVINYIANNSPSGDGLTFEAKTNVEESLDGTEYFEHREPYRVFNFTLADMTMAEGFAGALEIVRQANMDGELLLFPDPTDLGNAFRRNYMGRLRKLNPLTQPYYNATQMAFEVKEIR